MQYPHYIQSFFNYFYNTYSFKGMLTMSSENNTRMHIQRSFHMSCVRINIDREGPSIHIPYQ